MNNTVSNKYCTPEILARRFEGAWLMAITVFGVVVVVVGTVGNVIVIAAFATTRKLHKSCNVFLANLAAGDVVYCTVGFLVNVLPDHIPSLYCTKFAYFRYFVIAFCLQLSVANIMVLAAERIYGVEKPFHYRSHATVIRCFKIVTITWVLIAIRAAVVSALYTHHSFVLDCVSGGTALFLQVCTFLIYARVFYVSRRHIRKDKAFGIRTRHMKSQTATIVTMMYGFTAAMSTVVVTGFTIPYRNGPWFRIPFFLSLAGSCFNLLIFTFRMADFKRAALKLLRIKPKMELFIIKVADLQICDHIKRKCNDKKKQGPFKRYE